MFERYTEQAKRALEAARNEAASRGAQHITPSHLLQALSQDEASRAAQIAALKDRLGSFWTGAVNPAYPAAPSQAAGASNIPLHPETQAVLTHAEKEANRDWSQHIDTDHLLRGMLRFSNEASATLKSAGIHLPDVRAAAKKHRIEIPSARSSFRWVLKQIWRMAWPVIWRLAILAAVVGAIVYAIHR